MITSLVLTASASDDDAPVAPDSTSLLCERAG